LRLRCARAGVGVTVIMKCDKQSAVPRLGGKLLAKNVSDRYEINIYGHDVYL
jgi:hypothetical protein